MPVKIKCSHILVEKQSESLAIVEKIKKGEKFGRLAKELSIDSGSAKKDGNLGYFTKGMMVSRLNKLHSSYKLEKFQNLLKQNLGITSSKDLHNLLLL